ncbi:hypothetical protein ACLB2K_006588 [Fragaria x ananassa]
MEGKSVRDVTRVGGVDGTRMSRQDVANHPQRFGAYSCLESDNEGKQRRRRLGGFSGDMKRPWGRRG